jgi:hypothetical protein
MDASHEINWLLFTWKPSQTNVASVDIHDQSIDNMPLLYLHIFTSNE